MKSWAWHGLVLLAAALAPAFAATPHHTAVDLVLPAAEARPGEEVLAGVRLRMDPGWHTYWKNPGDSGMATQIGWSLPPGIQAGEVLWPVPADYSESGLTTYVYHDEVVLLVPLRIAADAPPGPVEVAASVNWLECADVCVPGSGNIQGRFVVGSNRQASQDAPVIEAWKKRLPQPGPGLPITAAWAGEAGEDSRRLVIRWDGMSEPFDFFPHRNSEYTLANAPAAEPAAGKGVVEKRVEKSGDDWPSVIGGVLVAGPGSKPEHGYEIELKPSLPVPGMPAAAGSLGLMLFFAFVGGLILNVMPCVLPVIALKVLGFVNHSRDHPGQVRKLGLIFGAGVLCSFLVLAAVVIAVQAAGRAADWGMQFGNPVFLLAMATLIVLVALNLFGVFEILLGGRAMGMAGALAAKEGSAGAFFNGALSTALATSCTAPFLGTALGFAFVQPPAVIVVFFLAIGAGLALPYVLLSFVPGLSRYMPKPGAWMEKFKIAMGFPMLATAVWLFYLMSAHYGRSGVLWLGLFLVFVALAAWVWGEFVQRGSRRRGLARAISAAIVLAGYVWALEMQLDWRAARAKGTTTSQLGHSVIPWQAWSREAVDEARRNGHPVLVDFTADWCFTCQLNKESSLEIAAVGQKLEEIGAVAFLADHTLIDPKITEELRRYNRAGVPMVLVFPADPSAPPIVLPELLKPSIVLDALDKVAARKS